MGHGMGFRRFWSRFGLVVCMLLAAILPGTARAIAGIGPMGWVSIGPDHLGGRLSALAIHPT